MRPLPAALQTAFEAPLVPLAYLWRVDRADGVALGFTTHDRPLRRGGLIYLPAPGITPSAVADSIEADVEGGEALGLLTDAAITEADLLGGRYDGARVELMLADWHDAAAGELVLISGTIGAVRAVNGRFEAELRTAESLLARTPIELTSPECRAELGDRRCRVDLAGRRRETVISAVVEAGVVETGDAAADERYAYGSARVLSGALAGASLRLLRAEAGRLTFEERADALAPGDRLRLTEGCDKRFATCRDRFANSANFRGEPHVPGRDSVMRYPGL